MQEIGERYIGCGFVKSRVLTKGGRFGNIWD